MIDRHTAIEMQYREGLCTLMERDNALNNLEVVMRSDLAGALCRLAAEMPWCATTAAVDELSFLHEKYGHEFVFRHTDIQGAPCLIERAIDVRAKSEEISRHVR